MTCPRETRPPSKLSFAKNQEVENMARKRHGAEEIITKLREAELMLSKGKSVPQACKKIGVTEQTY